MHERILNPYHHSMPVSNDMFSLFMDSAYKATKSSTYAKRVRKDRERTRTATTWTPTSAGEVSLQPHRAQTTRSAFHSSSAPALANRDKSNRNLHMQAAESQLFPDIAAKSGCSVTQSPCQLEDFVLVHTHLTATSATSATSVIPVAAVTASTAITSATAYIATFITTAAATATTTVTAAIDTNPAITATTAAAIAATTAAIAATTASSTAVDTTDCTTSTAAGVIVAVDTSVATTCENELDDGFVLLDIE